MKMIRIYFIFSIAVWFLPTLAFADKIGMLTGSTTGTYIKFGKNIADTVASTGIEIDVKESKGSIENIMRLASKENAALAVIQNDTLGHLKKSTLPELQGYAKKLRMIYPLYNEEIHLFAHKSIKSIHDLKGKRVVVNADGSGTSMTAENIMKLMEVQPKEKIYVSPLDGIVMLMQGKADAVFYVAGKPVSLFTNFFEEMNEDTDEGRALKKQLSTMHFVPLDDEKMRTEYVPSTITPQDYKLVTQTIPTMTVKAMLVSFDFSSSASTYHKKRCKQLQTIGRAIKDNLPQLRQTGHNKWKTVDLNVEVGDWKIDKCSHGLSNTLSGGVISGKVISSDTAEKRLRCRLKGGKPRNGRCIMKEK